MKTRYFFRVLGITIFSLFLLNSLGMAQIHYDNTGNVGIGTTSPAYKLSVRQETADHKIFQVNRPASDIAAIYIGNDSNLNAIIASNNNDLRIGEDGGGTFTEYIRVSRDTGNIGIDTTSPTEKLDVVGTVKATAFNLNGNTITSWPSGGGSEQWSEGTGGIYYNNGNVGIGTTSPSHKLDIRGSNTSPYGLRLHLKNTNPSDTGSNYTLIAMEDYGSSITAQWFVDKNGTSVLARKGVYFGNYTPTDLGLFTANQERVTINSNGNVGIGTTNPAYKLHVDGDIYATGTIHGASGTADTDWIESGGNVYRETGNVGIGTTSPDAKLAIDGDLRTTGEIVAHSALKIGRRGSYDDTGWMGIYGSLDSGGGYPFNNFSHLIIQPRDDRDLIFVTGPDYQMHPRMVINRYGNVGINTTSPSSSYKLDVAGPIRCTSLTQTSDIRLKEDITPIDNAIEKVTALHGVSFKWRAEEYPDKNLSEGRKIGLIAQEVEEVLPEVVSTDDEGYKSVEYGNMIGVLVEAIKELKSENEALRAEISALKAAIQS